MSGHAGSVAVWDPRQDGVSTKGSVETEIHDDEKGRTQRDERIERSRDKASPTK